MGEFKCLSTNDLSNIIVSEYFCKTRNLNEISNSYVLNNRSFVVS